MTQKRAAVARKIQTLRYEARNKAQNLFGERDSQFRKYERLLTFCHADTLEILLLLLWRHLQYYTEARPAGSQIQASTPHIARLVTSMDVELFKTEVPRKLSALLQRLDTLDMVIIIRMSQHTRADADLWRQDTEPPADGGDWRFNRAYIETICRWLRETSGLREPENDEQALM